MPRIRQDNDARYALRASFVDGNGDVITTDTITVGPDSRITDTQIANWDTAYGWGDHGAAGYMETGVEATTDLNTMITSGAFRINNTNPNRPADWGQVLVVRGGSDTIGQLYFDYTSNRKHYIRGGNSPDVGGSGSWSDWGQIVLQEDPVVLFGTDNQYLLSASSGSGMVYDDGLEVMTLAGNSTTGVLYINKTGQSNSQATDYIRFRNRSFDVGQLAYNGVDVQLQQLSDERLKTNIVDSPSALPVIDDMQVRCYDWVDSEKRGKHYGFIAQELNEAYPDAVCEGGDDPVTEPWMIGQECLIPVLVKAIQELKARVEELENVST